MVDTAQVPRAGKRSKKIPLWIGYGLTSGLQFLTVIVLARSVGREVLGQYAAITAFTLVVGRLADIGLPAAISYFVRTEPGHVGAVFRLVLLHIVVAVPVVFLAAYALRFVPFAEGNLDDAIAASTAFLALLMLAQLASGLFSNILIATERYSIYTLLQTAPHALLCAAVYAMHLVSEQISILELLPVFAATAAAPPLLVGIAMASTTVRRLAGDHVDARMLYAFGFQTLPGVTAKVIGTRLDRIILSLFLSVGSLGMYSVGLTIRTALLVPFQAYVVVLANDLLDEKKAGRSAYDYNMRAAAKWFAFMLTAGLAVFILAPYLVPLLFGPEFAPGVTTVRILAFAPAFECLSIQILQWLLVERRPSIVSAVHILGATTFALAITFASIKWGLEGAAYAATTSSAIVAVYALLAADHVRRASRGVESNTVARGGD